MNSREFLAKLDDTQIVSEIAKAERSTSGEIRVFVSVSKVDDAFPQRLIRTVRGVGYTISPGTQP